MESILEYQGAADRAYSPLWNNVFVMEFTLQCQRVKVDLIARQQKVQVCKCLSLTLGARSYYHFLPLFTCSPLSTRLHGRCMLNFYQLAASYSTFQFLRNAKHAFRDYKSLDAP